MIRVVNKHHGKYFSGDAIYIGRGSCLGNVFSHLPTSKASVRVGSREEAVFRYDDWLRSQYECNNNVKDAIDFIINRERQGLNTFLECFCKPKLCHGDSIKKFVEEKLDKKSVDDIFIF